MKPLRPFRGLAGWLVGMGLGAALIVALVVWWGWRSWAGPGPVETSGGSASIFVEIPPGMTLGAAADTLVALGMLRERTAFLAGARLTRQDRSLKAGLYQLEYGTSARGLLADLSRGLSVQVKVTVPEGLDAETTAEIMARGLDFDALAFLAAADSLVRSAAEGRGLLGNREQVAQLDSILGQASRDGIRTFHWSEGYLAPDTYHFAVGTPAASAAAHLVSLQLARLDSLFTSEGTANRVVRSAHELLTLASIVEAEARLDDERAKVAAVYSNRLGKKWRLEADPTVAFVLDKKGQRLFFRDLEFDSPFNTYRHQGLPPCPIGSPGRKALLAAAQPDTSCRAMYFVSDGQGGHVFSRTAREHEEAVQRFRQLKAAERQQGRH